MYAYTAGSGLMTVLTPGESTVALTEQMTMRTITNAEYAGIDDINITPVFVTFHPSNLKTTTLHQSGEEKRGLGEKKRVSERRKKVGVRMTTGEGKKEV